MKGEWAEGLTSDAGDRLGNFGSLFHISTVDDCGKGLWVHKLTVRIEGARERGLARGICRVTVITLDQYETKAQSVGRDGE